MDEFLNKLLSQIRCKKARPFIRDEIRIHIEEQISDNIRAGMDKEEAEREAIKDMGDPIEIGISLDRIHKPQINWKMLAIIIVISSLGLFLQYAISIKLNKDNIATGNSDGGINFAVSVLLGLAVMLFLYLIDYTTIGKYSKVIGAIMNIAAIHAILFGSTVAGRIEFIGFGPFRIQSTAFMMFYIPIYGAIIYKYRGGGFIAFIRAILWMLVPVFLVFRFPSLVVTGIMLISMLVQLTIALAKGWFQLSAKRTIILLWLSAIAFSIICTILFNPLSKYQAERITEFYRSSGESFWLTETLRKLLQNIAVIGSSGSELIGYLPDINRDYILSYVLNTYGLLAGVLLIALLAVLLLSIFSTAINQKNQLGCVMGCGCGMVLLMNIAINILGCLGLIPSTSSFLPFYSAGGSNLILSYALVGIVLSIYRFKSVYPQHVSVKLMQMKASIN